MSNETNKPNSELQRSFEPLRTCFALLSLLLGILVCLRA